MARFAFEALGIELTEGQPDTRQTRQTKEIPDLKKTLAVAGLGAAITLGSLVGAGTASASEVPSPDVPNPIGPEPCVFVIPIATPGHWMCPEGVRPPEMTP